MAYTKKNEARYIAHLDLTRVFDRALRRAHIEVAFSEGFNPHPKISFGPPLPVGVEGIQEYVDIDLKVAENIEVSSFLEKVMSDLQKQLPEGIELLDYTVLPQGSKALSAVINLAKYQIEVPVLKSISVEEFQDACNHWLTRDEALSVRNQKGKKVEKNIRPFVYEISISPIHDSKFLCRMDIKTGNEGSVRPVEILESIRTLENVPIDLPGVLTTREGLYIQNGQSLSNPIEFIRKA